jgi:hypothetical protein
MVNYFKKHTFIYSITTALFIIAACSSSEMKYSKNDQLSTIKKDYAGNPKRGNMFVNYEDVELPGSGGREAKTLRKQKRRKTCGDLK